MSDLWTQTLISTEVKNTEESITRDLFLWNHKDVEQVLMYHGDTQSQNLAYLLSIIEEK